MSIPAAADVAVTPQVLSAGGSSLALIGHFLTNNSAMPAGLTFSFPSTPAVIAFFGPAAIETAMAATYFQGFDNSDVKPAALLFSFYATSPTVAFLRGGNISGLTLTALQAINGTLSIVVNGTAQSGTVNLSTATSFSSAAQLIGTALGVVATYDSVSGGFGVFSTTPGAVSTIAYATGTAADALLLTQTKGAVTSQGKDADTPAIALPAIVARNTNWVSFTTTFEPSTAVKLAFAAWNSAQGNRYFYAMWDTDITATELGQTGSAGYQATQIFQYDGAFPVYAPINSALMGAFATGWAASLDTTRFNGRTTIKFRGLAGLSADVTDATVMANLALNGYNAMCSVATAAERFIYMRNGTISGQFQFADSYVNQIILNNSFQLALITLLSQVKSVPYNTPGYAEIEASLLDPIQAGLNFGSIRAGVALSNQQAAALLAAAGRDIATAITTRGYYILVQDPGALTRGVRGSPICVVFYADGQSVQQINLTSTDIQ
jgi:hypothetical protein